MLLVRIKKLTIAVILGTKPKERKRKQKVILDLSFEYNAKKAIKSDDLTQAIDYEFLTKTIIREVSRSHFFLAEALADFILNIVMKNPKIQKAEIILHKPKAIQNAKEVSIRLSKKKQGR
ncbi:MAG: dihydroneopterin aldolase [Candidatus Omnitrophota bacterium]